MARYVMNKNAQSNGDHEVHRDGCSWMPNPENQLELGDFAACTPAVAKAKTIDADADGCAHCSPACHTS